MRVLCVADSDSYVKWGAGLLGQLPSSWERSLVVLESPLSPSEQQLASALKGTDATHSAVLVAFDELRRTIAATPPDAVILSLTGPMVRVVLRMIAALPGPRPVFVSGLPGISFPPTRRALILRSQVDLLVLHSHREIRAYTELAGSLGIDLRFALNSLPFLERVLHRDSDSAAERAGASGQGSVVFAAQAKVPITRADRERVVEWLRRLAMRQPERRVVIKLRAVRGEQQTHRERFPYDELVGALDDMPTNLELATGSMADYLADADALVTVSSTAALEAVALGRRALILSDFGVDAIMINEVFQGSGLIGDADDLVNGRFAKADPGWLTENYLHDPGDDDWLDQLERCLTARATGSVPLRPYAGQRFGGALRKAWDRRSALGRHDRSVIGAIASLVGHPMRLAATIARRALRSMRRDA